MPDNIHDFTWMRSIETLQVKCKECEKELDIDNPYMASGNHLCDKCENTHKICQICSKSRKNENMEEMRAMGYRGISVCKECVTQRTVDCGDCSQSFLNLSDKSVEIDGEDVPICRSCEGNYAHCEECSVTRHRDQMNGCNDCGEWRCNDHRCSCSVYRRVDLHPLDGMKRGKTLDIKRLVGVEIEFEKGDKWKISDEVSQRCGIVYDGSLSNGLEIVTPPATTNIIEELIHEICSSVKKNGGVVNNNCGLHVHIDGSASRISTGQLLKIMKTTYVIEDILLAMNPPSRWDNRFCQKLSQNYSFTDLNRKIKRHDFEKVWYKDNNPNRIDRKKREKYQDTRYSGLNLHSYWYRGSIEFRHHAGTLNPKKIINWVYILLKVVNYAINHYNEKEIADLYNTPIAELKIEKFCHIFKIKNEVKEYIKDRIKTCTENYALKPTTKRIEINMADRYHRRHATTDDSIPQYQIDEPYDGGDPF